MQGTAAYFAAEKNSCSGSQYCQALRSIDADKTTELNMLGSARRRGFEKCKERFERIYY